jgi:cyanophycinase-like exopeptidase
VTRLLLLGSGEFLPWAAAVERHALKAATGDGSVAVLATASGTEGHAVFDGWGERGVAHYASLGISAVAVPVQTRSDALDAHNARRIDDVSMVFFSGGKPSYLASTVAETPVWEAVQRLLKRGGVFAGCSAGAMIAGAPGLRFPFRSGLGLLSQTAIGVHWDALARPGLNVLREFMVRRVPRGVQFLGIAEQTAITTDGDAWRVFGRGEVDERLRRRRTMFRDGDVIPVR